MPRPAVFVDRDGTLIEEADYLKDVNQFRMFPFVAAAIRRLNKAGLPVIVISNQSGVARGYFPESFVKTIEDLMRRQLALAGAHLDGSYYCPHLQDAGCMCRKPKPGMLEQAAREHTLDLPRSFVVGDKYVDIELAHVVGARGILVRTGYGEDELQRLKKSWPKQPDCVASDLSDATHWILRQNK